MTDKTSALLDATLDDLADLPGFKVPPTGAYALEVMSVLEKEIGDHAAVEAKFTIREVVEVSEQNVPEDQMPVPGDECNIAFMLDNDTGVGFFKEFLKPLGEKLGTKKNREIMSGAKGMLLMVVLKRTHDKEKDRHYLNLKKVEVI